MRRTQTADVPRDPSEWPTKPQSGAYAIMRDACSEIERDLERARSTVDGGAERTEVESLLVEIRTIAERVSTWRERSVDEAMKAGEVERILDIMQRTRSLAGVG